MWSRLPSVVDRSRATKLPAPAPGPVAASVTEPLSPRNPRMDVSANQRNATAPEGRVESPRSGGTTRWGPGVNESAGYSTRAMPVSPCTALTSSSRRLSHHSATAGATIFPESLPTHRASSVAPGESAGLSREHAVASTTPPIASRPKAASGSRKDPLGGLPEAVGVRHERVHDVQAGELAHVVLAHGDDRKAVRDAAVVFRLVLEQLIP